jgi:type II secretory pathway pseudopilin PulG
MRWLSDISRRSRRASGFSMLELLVGIGIVLAVAAVAVPWTMGWLGSRELDHAEDGLTMQMMMARAAAREEGRPVEVVAEFDGTQSRINARWMVGSGSESPRRSGRRGGQSNDSGFGTDLGTDREFGREDDIKASWASMELPKGVRIALGLESAAAGIEGADDAAFARSSGSTPGSSAASETAQGQTLAIFLPDGSVFLAPIFMLRTDAGSLRAMKVDRATGVPQKVAQPTQSANGAGDRPEFDAPDGESADEESSAFDPAFDDEFSDGFQADQPDAAAAP